MAIATYEGIILVHDEELIEQVLIDGYRDGGHFPDEASYRAAQLAKAIEQGDSIVKLYFSDPVALASPIAVNKANLFAGYELISSSPQRMDSMLLEMYKDARVMLHHIHKGGLLRDGSAENNRVTESVAVASKSPYSYDNMSGW